MARRMTMEGQYSPEAYHVNVSSQGEGKDGPDMMSMKMEMAGKHMGECSTAELKEDKADAKG